MAAAGDVIKYTTCAGHCLNVCILKVRVRDGVIVSIEPDDTINTELTRDYEQLPEELVDAGMVQRRPCAKGYAWLRQLYDPNRLIYPMKRVGERGEGKFERISWEEAIETVAGKLVETKEKYGPYSIMHNPYSLYGTCSFPLAPWFGAGFACWQNHSCAGWEQPRIWVLGKDPSIPWLAGMGTAVNDLVQDDLNLFKSKLIVLWGMNPTSNWGGGGANNLLRAKKLGIPIICIDPRYTPTVEVLADQWIPIRPTTDVAMMIAMANVWFKEDLCDKEFIAEYVEPEGLERWKAYVLGKEDGVDKTPAWAQEICGVPAETIEAFARLYARSKPVNLNSSLTLGRQYYGENAARASMYLQALTGNTFIPGGTAAADTGLWMGQPKWPVPVLNFQGSAQDAGEAYVAPTLMELHKWAKSIDIREKLDNGEITHAEYNNLIGNTADAPSPNIQMVIMESNNHVGTLPEMNTTIRAMKKVGFSVVWSQFADQDSARYADILLPLGHFAFEGKNEHFWGMWWVWDNCFILRQKCVEPPGEIRPVDWFWTQVAKKLGMGEQYNPRMLDVPHDKWHDALMELYREGYENWATLPEIAPLNPPSWAEFLEKPIFRFDNSKDPHHPFKPELDRGENPFAATESGKFEIYSKLLAKGPEYLSRNEAQPGNRCYGGGNLPPMAKMLKGGKDTFFSEDTRKYPLLMSSPHAYYRVHSWLDNNPLLRGDCYRHAVWMSVPDAKSREIKDNDLVRIHNDIAEMVIPAYVTSRIVPGTVAIHHGGWYRPGKEKTDLMPDGIDRGGAPNLFTHNQDLPDTVVGFYPCKGLVQIEKWEGA